MRLRDIIICAAAMACAAVMTSCKDDDKSETLNINGLWSIGSSMAGQQNTYYMFESDSVSQYVQFSEEFDTGKRILSPDSLYESSSRIAVTEPAVSNEDSSVVKGKYNGEYEYTFVLTKTTDGKYLIVMRSMGGTMGMMNVKRADEMRSRISTVKLTE